MARRLTGLNPLSYLGVDPVNPTQAVIYNRNPTVNDYDNFTLQCQWLNSSTQQVWVLVSKTDFIAVWKELTGGGGSGGIQTITGDVGGAVGPDGSNNIDLQGGAHYVFTGNPGSNLLTLTDNGTIAYTYTGDSGVATPSANNLNIVGSGIISTTGSGDTLTITAAGSVPVSIVVDSGGPVTPAGGVLDVLGGNNITTTGAGNTITVDVTGTTDNAVQVGNASGSLTSLPLGTDGQIIIAATGSTPLFADLTSTDMSVTITAGANTLDLSVAGAGPGVTTIHTDSGNASPAGGTLNVYGDASHIQTTGAGNTVTAELYGFTDNAPVVGNVSGSLDSLSPMTTGELMIGVTGSVPNLARLTAGSNVTIDDLSVPGEITIDTTGSVATTYDGNTGSATPSSNIMNIVGDGTTATTVASGNTVTITAIGGGGSGDLILLETQTVSGVTEVDFTTGITNTYRNFVLMFDNVPIYSPTSSPFSFPTIQLSTNSGVSYITTGYNNNNSSNNIGLDLTASQSATADMVASGSYNIYNMTSGTGYVTGGASSNIKFSPTGPLAASPFVGGYNTANIVVDAIRIVWDSPDLTTIDGTFSLYGYVV